MIRDTTAMFTVARSRYAIVQVLYFSALFQPWSNGSRANVPKKSANKNLFPRATPPPTLLSPFPFPPCCLYCIGRNCNRRMLRAIEFPDTHTHIYTHHTHTHTHTHTHHITKTHTHTHITNTQRRPLGGGGGLGGDQLL